VIRASTESVSEEELATTSKDEAHSLVGDELEEDSLASVLLGYSRGASRTRKCLSVVGCSWARKPLKVC
jgi:hypothetical protein